LRFPKKYLKTIESIRRWYNGFSWDGCTAVYNPYSTLLLFDNKKFDEYWFASGTPTFLIDILRERNDVKYVLEPTQVSGGFDSFDITNVDTKVLLFQTGYLTVKSAARNPFSENMIYTLGIPNEEVRKALMIHLVAAYAKVHVSDTGSIRDSMFEQLFNGDAASFERSLRDMFARIPYQLHIPREAYYHSLLLLWLNMIGFEVMAEIPTDKGRIDAVWTWKERAVIAEIKYAAKGSCARLLDAAFAQIKKQRYYERYMVKNNRVALLAVAFAGKSIACKMEELT